MTFQVNTPPVATIDDRSLDTNEWWRIGYWLSYWDDEGIPKYDKYSATTRYQFWDGGTNASSGYFWTPNNAHHAAGTIIEVAGFDLDDVWVRGGQVGGSETMWVRAFDGKDWGSWDAFQLTTNPNYAPVATINDHSLHINEWSTVASWISYYDANKYSVATKYQFWDGDADASSGYFWTPNDAHHTAGNTIEVVASQLASVWVRGGAAAGSETMWVRAFDGTDWSEWDAFQLTTLNTPPVATIGDHFLHPNEWSQVSNWLNYSDADGNAATKYQFSDTGADVNSGYFWTPSNAHHLAYTPIEVEASDLANVWIRGGTIAASETMYVRAFDGTDWSEWDSFTFTTVAHHAPVATIDDHSLHINEWSTVAGWLNYSDADGNAATKYEFWDGGTDASSGYFWTPSNAHHAAGTAIEVAASDLADLWVHGGAAAGAETMWVRAYDGNEWSAWDAFQLNTLL